MNTPLTKAQIKDLPYGFTPTGTGNRKSRRPQKDRKKKRIVITGSFKFHIYRQWLMDKNGKPFFIDHYFTKSSKQDKKPKRLKR